MGWMTARECADWWRDLLNQTTDSVYAKMEKYGVGADTDIGLNITWSMHNMNSVLDMFLFDPLRLGSGTGEAVGDTRPGFGNSAMRVLNVVADIGRATVFLPLGKLTRLGRVASIEERTAASGMSQGALQAGARTGPAAAYGDLAAGAAEPFGIHPYENTFEESSRFLERIFQIAPDAAPGHNICGWDTLTRALRDTQRWYIRIEDIARFMRVKMQPFSTKTAEALSKLNMRSIRDYNAVLARLGIAAREIPLRDIKSMAQATAAAMKRMGKHTDEVTEALKLALQMQSKKGVMVFLVEWLPPNSTKWVGHVMYAKLDDAGRFVIVDRSGFQASSLAQLEFTQPGIRNARFMEPEITPGYTGGLLFIEDATVGESKVNFVRAVQQVQNNPMFDAFNATMLGPLAIPVKLRLHIPATPNIPRPPRPPGM